MADTPSQAPATATEHLANAVLDLNHGWNAKETEHLIAQRIDLARRLALAALAAPQPLAGQQSAEAIYEIARPIFSPWAKSAGVVLPFQLIEQFARRLSASPVAMQQETEGHAVAPRAEEVADDEVEELHALNATLSDLLTRSVNALRGDPPPLTCWSWHDLPDRIRAAMCALQGATELALEATPSQPQPRQHYSDCAVHNEPAYPAGECDCGGIPSVLAMAEEAKRLAADMFWDNDDVEVFAHDIEDIVANYGPGELVKIDQAKRLPTITVRVIQDPDDSDRLTYEEVASHTQEGAQGHAVAFPTGPISDTEPGPLTACDGEDSYE